MRHGEVPRSARRKNRPYAASKESLMKIIIAGAGMGGMIAAERLAKLGFDVTVYEKAASVDEMRYDWHDDVNPSIFRRLGLEMPAGSFRKKSWTFISPHGAVVREFRQDDSTADWSVERRPLNRMLYERAAAGAKFVFGATVERPVVEKGVVVGVVVNGREERADLVIDSLGADSALKKDLPAEFGVSRHREDEVFVAYRAFYERDPDAPAPKYTNKVYLKHMGEPGISWVIQDNDPSLVNVLVGRIGSLSSYDLERALEDLRKTNPTIGGKVVRGGEMCVIPVRYPATRMVANGYAAVGDAAYMTIPMLGSGIASGMLAGQLLAETIGENMSRGVKKEDLFKTSRLWKYQVKVFREFGAVHCAVDVLKRGVLNFPDAMLDWMLGSEVLTNEEIGCLAAGKMLRVGVKEAIRKINVTEYSRMRTLIKVNNLLQKSLYAYRVARNIPRNYDPNICKSWEKQLKRIYRR